MTVSEYDDVIKKVVRPSLGSYSGSFWKIFGSVQFIPKFIVWA